MRTFAYCTQPAARAVARAIGNRLSTAPPWSAKDFPAQEILPGRDFLYFRLHQIEGMPLVWLGEDYDGNMAPALRVEQVRGLDLGGAVVMIANCYSADSPFIPAFYECGAQAVLGAPGPNFAASNRVVGADLLAMWLIRAMRLGLDVRRALAVAKTRLTITAYRATDRDALAFQVIGDQDYERA